MRPATDRIRICATIGLLLIGDSLLAQSAPQKAQIGDYTLSQPANAKRAKPRTTIIDVELLQAEDASGLHAQHWLKVLAPLDISVRVHRPTSEEKPQIKERESAGVRYVTAIGMLERTGQISFPETSFAIGENTKLKEWIEELRTYGARGTPSGKPLWGLTKGQFTEIYEALAKPVEFETFEMPLAQLLAKLPLPRDKPVNWTPEGRERAARRGAQLPLQSELQSLSAGTALAIALNESGLVFRPNRRPQGDLELLIEPLATKSEHWPIGWPIQQPRFKSAPKLFATVPIELSEVELVDVLNAASKLTDTPILVDYFELQSKKIELNSIKVSYPAKKTNWDVALKTMAGSQRLATELWQDEVGRPFVWITTPRIGRPGESDRLKP